MQVPCALRTSVTSCAVVMGVQLASPGSMLKPLGHSSLGAPMRPGLARIIERWKTPTLSSPVMIMHVAGSLALSVVASSVKPAQFCCASSQADWQSLTEVNDAAPLGADCRPMARALRSCIVM